jgi:hypothetical protein
MAIQEKLAEILRTRKQADESPRDQKTVEFIVSFSPSGTLRWKVVDAQTGQPRPPIFGRSEVKLPTDGKLLDGSRIIAHPEGNPTGFFAAGFNENVDADFSIFFFCTGAVTGDSFVYQKDRGDKLELHLFGVQNAQPFHIFSTTITDDEEHSATIQIPKA